MKYFRLTVAHAPSRTAFGKHWPVRLWSKPRLAIGFKSFGVDYYFGRIIFHHWGGSSAAEYDKRKKEGLSHDPL